jgi:hypothetical protein
LVLRVICESVLIIILTMQVRISNNGTTELYLKHVKRVKTRICFPTYSKKKVEFELEHFYCNIYPILERSASYPLNENIQELKLQFRQNGKSIKIGTLRKCRLKRN